MTDSIADTPGPPDTDAARLRDLFAQSRHIVAFTGAGISAESGIPTYRGQGGMWTTYDPEKYASIYYFRADPSYFWSFFRDVRQGMVRQAQPNDAHRALAELERRGTLAAVVTQNIDGLHQRAGSRRVLELHGNTTRFYCCDCLRRSDLDEVALLLEEELVPHCAACGGVLRPDVVLFGELLPEGVFEESSAEASRCDLMLVIGSSLVVVPAADIPYQAKLSGARLAIINIDPTPMDSVADLVFHTPAVALMKKAVVLDPRL